jgi:glycosyltransferase involved in cell wall biosynthesis
MTTSVSICIATYKRPASLEKLILAIEQLSFVSIATPTIEIVVVDNDPAGSARSICENLQQQIRWQLKYDVELRSGVTYARNRTIANIAEHTDFIAIVDDDEVPNKQWLEQLLKVQAEYEADIVTGPVYPCFEDDNTPLWIKEGNFFEPRKRETGSQLNVAFTNNVLIKTICLDGIDPVFDHRFATKGSEDSHLFMRLYKNQCKIVWAGDAIVQESISASRTTLKWLVQRNFWGWSSYSLFEKEIFASSKKIGIRAIKGVGLIGVGLIALPFSLTKGKSAMAKAIIDISRGLGTLSGLVGFQGQW